MKLYYNWRCRSCENGPCVVCYRDPLARPHSCPTCGSSVPTIPVWNLINSPADDVFALFEWKEDVMNDWISTRNYPDWFWNLAAGFADDGVKMLQILQQAFENERFIKVSGDSEVDKSLAKFKKTDVARAFAKLGFQTGLIYSEWRRKAEQTEDFELVEE